MSAPSENEIEISLFGPGYGESIVLHAGQNEWFIINSCVDSSSNAPAPLKYLQHIDIDISKQVKQVISTHWHDDHIRGLGQIVRECNTADFVCSSALNHKDFFTLIRAYHNRAFMANAGSGVQEFSEIINELKKTPGRLKWAIAERTLWKSHSCTIYALSPSDASLLLSYREIAKLVPQDGESIKSIQTKSPNHASTVLWCEIGKHAILLGADLEETKNTDTGWTAILTSKLKPKEKASIFKIPHHGSKTSDKPQVWSDMLEDDPVAILTPYINGRVTLPTEEDVKRINKRTRKAYATTNPRAKKPRRRSSVVERQIKDTVRNFRPRFTSTGQIRIRIQSCGKLTVDLFNGAIPLTSLYVA